MFLQNLILLACGDDVLAAKTALLQALTAPGYGLQLIERVRRRSDGRVRLNLGSVYPALRSLQRQGLVTVSRQDTPAGGGRPRRYYELTLEGVRVTMAQREALQGFLGHPPPLARDSTGEMLRRLESCAELSDSLLELQQLTQTALQEET